MSIFGKDKENEEHFNQESDYSTSGSMSMDEIDRLLDEDELDRMLNDDVSAFIDSENFKELLDAEDIDDILNIYRKSGSEDSNLELKSSFDSSIQPETKEDLPIQQKEETIKLKEETPKPLQKQEEKKANLFAAQNKPKTQPPKYQERFQSFTVEINRSEVEELAKKQAQQQAAVNAKVETLEEVFDDKREDSFKVQEILEKEKHTAEKAEQVVSNDKQEEHKDSTEETVAQKDSVASDEEQANTNDHTFDKEFDIDALIREIEQESKAYGLSDVFSEHNQQEELKQEKKESESQVESKDDKETEPVSLEKKPEVTEQDVNQEPEYEKVVEVQDTTFEIDIPKEELKEKASIGTFEINIPKEKMESSQTELGIKENKSSGQPQKDLSEKVIVPKKQEITPSLTIDPAELPSQKMGDKKHRYALLGVVMTLLAVVGVIAVVYLGFGVAKDFFSQKEIKEEFNQRVYPLVVVDVPTFSSVDKLDSKVVIQAGIWNFLLNEENKDKYQKDEFGTMTVPASDIEVYIRQIFGSKVEIVNQQLSDADFTVIYDEKKDLYYVPTIPQTLPNAPSVQSVTHTGNDYKVTVGYVLPGTFWNVKENADNGEISKTMIYHYTKTKDGNYWIKSVENGDLSLNTTSYPEEDMESEIGAEEQNVSSETNSEAA